MQSRVPARGNKASKPLLKKFVRAEAAGETPSLTGQLAGETHWVLESTQTHLPGESAPEGPICLWIVEEVTESQQSAEQAALFPLGPLPHSTTTQQSGCPALANT